MPGGPARARAAEPAAHAILKRQRPDVREDTRPLVFGMMREAYSAARRTVGAAAFTSAST